MKEDTTYGRCLTCGTQVARDGLGKVLKHWSGDPSGWCTGSGTIVPVLLAPVARPAPTLDDVMAQERARKQSEYQRIERLRSLQRAAAGDIVEVFDAAARRLLSAAPPTNEFSLAPVEVRKAGWLRDRKLVREQVRGWRILEWEGKGLILRSDGKGWVFGDRPATDLRAIIAKEVAYQTSREWNRDNHEGWLLHSAEHYQGVLGRRLVELGL